MIPYFAVMLTDSFRVLDGRLATWLHCTFAFICPVYIPFGVIYYVQRQYMVCSFMMNCDQLDLAHYLEMPEIYLLYVALLFHTLVRLLLRGAFKFLGIKIKLEFLSKVWGAGLRVVDILNGGGNVASLFRGRVAANTNPDTVMEEDSDVNAERAAVQEHFRTGPDSQAVIAVEGLRKEFSGSEKEKPRNPCKKAQTQATKIAVRNLSLKVV